MEQIPTEMYGMRTSDHDRPQIGKKKITKDFEEKKLEKIETLW